MVFLEQVLRVYGSCLARVSVVGRVVQVLLERVLWRCGDGHVRGVMVLLLL